MFAWLLGGGIGALFGSMLFESAVATFSCAVIVGFVFWAIMRGRRAGTRSRAGSSDSGGGDFAWAADGDCASGDGGGDGGGGDGGGGCD